MKWQCPVCRRAFSVLPGHEHLPIYHRCIPLLGNFIANATSAIGIRGCNSCDQRQAALNSWDEWLRTRLFPDSYSKEN